jgi:hypothetical protein
VPSLSLRIRMSSSMGWRKVVMLWFDDNMILLLV